MSNPSLDAEPSDNKVLLSALAWIGVIFIFIFILAVAYLPNRSVSIEEQQAEARYDILRNVRSEQAQLLDSYAWVDQANGVVRIPVERSMRLSVTELKARERIGENGSGAQ